MKEGLPSGLSSLETTRTAFESIMVKAFGLLARGAAMRDFFLEDNIVTVIRREMLYQNSLFGCGTSTAI
jgi:hypothetical protein